MCSPLPLDTTKFDQAFTETLNTRAANNSRYRGCDTRDTLYTNCLYDRFVPPENVAVVKEIWERYQELLDQQS